MAKKEKAEKTVEELAQEFLQSERKSYEERMLQAEIDRENAAEPKVMFPEETPEVAAEETETNENEGE